jgi:hypothetical protein
MLISRSLDDLPRYGRFADHKLKLYFVQLAEGFGKQLLHRSAGCKQEGL